MTPSPQDRLQLLQLGLHLPQDFLIVTLFDLNFMCSEMNFLISKSLGPLSVEVEVFALISFLESIGRSLVDLVCGGGGGIVDPATLRLLFVSTSPICAFDEPSI
jgi:hypothetical protein